jgi:hypothetical protein
MIFGSRDPQTLNSDPEPWIVDPEPEGINHGIDLWRVSDKWKRGYLSHGPSACGYIFSLRPEFTPTLAHPHNPILAAFRYSRPEFRLEFLSGTDGACWIAEDLAPEATPDQIDHARRVLTRLAKWKENA